MPRGIVVSILVALASLYSEAVADLSAPRADLVFWQHEQTKGIIRVRGFAGCAASGSDTILLSLGGKPIATAGVAHDGSFTVEASVGPPSGNMSLQSRDARGHLSMPFSFPSVTPCLGGMEIDNPRLGVKGAADNEYGWLHLASADISITEANAIWRRVREQLSRRNAWKDSVASATGRTDFEVPDSLDWGHTPWMQAQIRKVPEDLRVFGYSATGDQVTCIVPGTNSVFSDTIASDGTFSLIISKEAIARSTSFVPSMVVNVVDSDNRLVGFFDVQSVPVWALDREEEKERKGLIGKPVPDFALPRLLDSSVVRVGDLRGKRVIINLWATWCQPCIEELPVFERLHQSSPSDSTVVLLISLDRSLSKARRVFHRNGYSVCSLGDSTGLVEKVLPGWGIPRTYVVSPDGIVRFAHIGPLTEEEVRSALETVIP